MRIPYAITTCLSFALLLGACDGDESPKSEGSDPADAADGAPAVAVELEPGKTAASFQLSAVVELVQGNTVADAKALEAKINDPKAKLNAVDLDDDGETDFVEVIEVKNGDEVSLEFLAIPSSKKQQKPADVGVVIATITLDIQAEKTLVVHGVYTKHIDHDATIHVYHHEEPVLFENGVVLVPTGCFYHYVFVYEHEVYHGHHHYIVVAPKVHIEHDVHHDVHYDVHLHGKHKKSKGHKGKGKGHKGHW